MAPEVAAAVAPRDPFWGPRNAADARGSVACGEQSFCARIAGAPVPGGGGSEPGASLQGLVPDRRRGAVRSVEDHRRVEPLPSCGGDRAAGTDPVAAAVEAVLRRSAAGESDSDNANALCQHGRGRSVAPVGALGEGDWSGIRGSRTRTVVTMHRTLKTETAKPPAASVAAQTTASGRSSTPCVEALGRSRRRRSMARAGGAGLRRRARGAPGAPQPLQRGDRRQRGAGRHGRGRGNHGAWIVRRRDRPRTAYRAAVQETAPFPGGPAGPPGTGTENTVTHVSIVLPM